MLKSREGVTYRVVYYKKSTRPKDSRGEDFEWNQRI
ncbi:hypothetical protein [Bacillus phage BSTP8]|nr:hypothetical protein BSTP5_068 [Bacillus phage BSTP5]QRI44337.1 hypothetical protein [Bacillus phage BSTP8]QRI44431.1 hypothetical protein [Bacillus phage BSTP10]QRI44479.1 hypothetical protein [Bacillus phage BSTP12]